MIDKELLKKERQRIGLNILMYRRKLNMTQNELAERCAMSQNALVNIEKNRSQPPMETMKRLQEALGVPQSYILLYSIEDCDIPEDKLKTAKHLLMPLKDYLLREDF